MAMNISSRRGSLEHLHELQAEMKRLRCCTNAAVRAHSIEMEAETSSSHTTPECKKGLFLKLKETVSDVTHHGIEIHMPKISRMHSSSEELLEDLPSDRSPDKKEPFWKSMSLTRTHCSKEARRKYLNTSIDHAKRVNDEPGDHNIACVTHCKSEEFILASRSSPCTQSRRLSNSLSMLVTDEKASLPKVNSDNLLSHLLDSQLPSTNLGFSISSIVSQSSDSRDGSIGGATASRRGCIGTEKVTRRRSSRLLELDNALHYGGLSLFED